MNPHRIRRCLTLGLVALPWVGAALAQDLPKDVLVNTKTPSKTVWHYPKADSAVPEERAHRRDLSKWTTLSYEDTRPTPAPQRVSLQGELKGDAERGKKIAMNTQQGNCWACHALPGDAQPGTAGPSLLAFAKRNYSNEKVYQQVFDARIQNPYTFMPPYGSFSTLGDQDIRDIVAYLQSIQ